MLARSGTAVTLGFAGVRILEGTDELITGAEGAFVVRPASATGVSGVAGFLTGTLEMNSQGASLGGTVMARVNSTQDAVDETVEVDGRTLAITFSDPGTAVVFDISVTDMTIDIGGFVTIEGNVTFSNGSSPATGSGSSSAAARRSRTPARSTRSPPASWSPTPRSAWSGTAAGYALVASGTVRSSAWTGSPSPGRPPSG